MEKDLKDILLKDLSARLPYDIKASYYGAEEECETWDEIEGISSDGYVDIGQYSLPIESVKPYLFPLSSMTKEQSKIYHELIGGMFGTSALINFELLEEFFNKNHFDYRGLIKKGLAIDATNLNIYINYGRKCKKV